MKKRATRSLGRLNAVTRFGEDHLELFDELLGSRKVLELPEDEALPYFVELAVDRLRVGEVDQSQMEVEIAVAIPERL